MSEKMMTGAVIVAAGKGSRMKSDCPKQFIEVCGKPILYYTLKAFEASSVDEIVVVTSLEYVDYVKCEIVDKYNIQKVKSVIAGGKERYESVYQGLLQLQQVDCVLVHDGARPFVEPHLINKVIDEVKMNQAVIVGVPSKDTVKIVDEKGFVKNTPRRSDVWNIQTPQAFMYDLLKNAYDKVMSGDCSMITDDAMVVETATRQAIKVMEGSYSNIKITTIEDLNEQRFQEISALYEKNIFF